jgi:hypothetical protein
VALEFTSVPTTAGFAILLVLGGAWLNHRLAIVRGKKKEVPLSSEEKEVLIAAAKTGKMLLMRVDIHGEWLRAGGTDFFQREEPAFAAKYLEAFRRLSHRGFVVTESGAFRLSGTGFAVARGLTKG